MSVDTVGVQKKFPFSLGKTERPLRSVLLPSKRNQPFRSVPFRSVVCIVKSIECVNKMGVRKRRVDDMLYTDNMKRRALSSALQARQPAPWHSVYRRKNSTLPARV